VAKQKDSLNSLLKSYLDGLLDTIETLQSHSIMEQLRKSGNDLRKGRVRSAREFLQEQI
jgi:hypothetical protein